MALDPGTNQKLSEEQRQKLSEKIARLFNFGQNIIDMMAISKYYHNVHYAEDVRPGSKAPGIWCGNVHANPLNLTLQL